MPKFCNLEIESKKDKKIWRYIDLNKFLFMVTHSTITFTNIKNFDDPDDSMYLSNLKAQKIIKEHIKKIHGQEIHPDLVEVIEKSKKFLKEQEENPYDTFASCWALREEESVALWDLYVPNKRTGIAKQTTVGKLAKQLRDRDIYAYDVKDDTTTKIESNILMRDVIYAKNKREAYELNNDVVISDSFIKRPCFNYEEEYRAVISDVISKDICLHIRVNLRELIENIYISPRIQEWSRYLIVDLIQTYNDKYKFLGEDCKVNKSSIFDRY